jgi:hypothetical protein
MKAAAAGQMIVKTNNQIERKDSGGELWKKFVIVNPTSAAIYPLPTVNTVPIANIG